MWEPPQSPGLVGVQGTLRACVTNKFYVLHWDIVSWSAFLRRVEWLGGGGGGGRGMFFETGYTKESLQNLFLSFLKL